MKERWILVLTVVLCVIFGAAGSNMLAQEWKPEIKFLKIGTGSSGGIWYPQGAIIAETINKTLSPLTATVTPGGSVSNIIKLEQNELQMAMTNTFLDGLAWEGKAPFEKPHRNIRHLVSTVPYSTNIVVRADSGINKIEDLKDKKIVVGSKGFITELLIRKVLEAHGITYETITKNRGLVTFGSYKEGIALLQDKHADMFVLEGVHPLSSLLGLSTQTKIKLLGIEQEKMKKILAENPGLWEIMVPDKPGTYGMDKLVPALAKAAIYMVRQDYL
jgi:TRAP transporter TAXI family solute receptor